jgi:hypothetical protein
MYPFHRARVMYAGSIPTLPPNPQRPDRDLRPSRDRPTLLTPARPCSVLLLRPQAEQLFQFHHHQRQGPPRGRNPRAPGGLPARPVQGPTAPKPSQDASRGTQAGPNPENGS